MYKIYKLHYMKMMKIMPDVEINVIFSKFYKRRKSNYLKLPIIFGGVI